MRTPLRNQDGMTLVEIIVGLALLTSAFMTATASYISVSRLQQNTATVRTVQQNGRFVLQNITRDIRNASVVTVPPSASPGSCITLAGGTAVITPTVTYAFVPRTGLISNNTGSCTVGTTVETGDTRISDGSFIVGQPDASQKQFVTVNLLVKQGDASLDGSTDPNAYSYNLTTSVELREQP